MIVITNIFYTLFLTSVAYLSITLTLDFGRIIHAMRPSSLYFTNSFVTTTFRQRLL